MSGNGRPLFGGRVLFPAAVAVLLLGACATTQHNPMPVTDEPPFAVDIDPSVEKHLYDVQQFFPTEQVFCLNGAALLPRVVILSASIARTTYRKENKAGYDESSCDDPQFIGVAHNHPGNIGCHFSTPDSTSFALSQRSVIDLVVARRCMKVRVRGVPKDVDLPMARK